MLLWTCYVRSLCIILPGPVSLEDSQHQPPKARHGMVPIVLHGPSPAVLPWHVSHYSSGAYLSKCQDAMRVRFRFHIASIHAIKSLLRSDKRNKYYSIVSKTLFWFLNPTSGTEPIIVINSTDEEVQIVNLTDQFQSHLGSSNVYLIDTESSPRLR